MYGKKDERKEHLMKATGYTDLLENPPNATVAAAKFYLSWAAD